MTRAKILSLPAGRELDTLVAHHVLGWRWFRVERQFETGFEWWRSLDDGHYNRPGWCQPAVGDEPIWSDFGARPGHYSTQIAAAWGLVEHVADAIRHRNRGSRQSGDPLFHLMLGADGRWRACFLTQTGHDYVSEGDTAPHAVARAALLAAAALAATMPG